MDKTEWQQQKNHIKQESKQTDKYPLKRKKKTSSQNYLKYHQPATTNWLNK